MKQKTLFLRILVLRILSITLLLLLDVKNVWSRNGVTWSGAELLWSGRKLTTKVGNDLGLSSYTMPQSAVM